MKRRRFLAVTVGVLVLSAGLVLMTDSARAAPPTKSTNTHTQNWDENLPSASRFTTVFTGAVRDNNTGLVWEQAPDATTRIWGLATSAYCVNKNVGGTRGWRLPSVAELASVLDGSPDAVAPFVPASTFTIGGSPGVQSDFYWSASVLADFPTTAWGVNFFNGFVSNTFKTSAARAWCVRGPMQESVY